MLKFRSHAEEDCKDVQVHATNTTNIKTINQPLYKNGNTETVTDKMHPNPDKYPNTDKYPTPDKNSTPDKYTNPDKYTKPDNYATSDKYPTPDIVVSKVYTPEVQIKNLIESMNPQMNNGEKIVLNKIECNGDKVGMNCDVNGSDNCKGKIVESCHVDVIIEQETKM